MQSVHAKLTKLYHNTQGQFSIPGTLCKECTSSEMSALLLWGAGNRFNDIKSIQQACVPQRPARAVFGG